MAKPFDHSDRMKMPLFVAPTKDVLRVAGLCEQLIEEYQQARSSFSAAIAS